MNKAKAIAINSEYINLLTSGATELVFTDAEVAGILGAMGKRGKHKGFLRGTCPSQPYSAAAWCALTPNHHKLGQSVGRLMMLPLECQSLFDRLSPYRHPSCLDLDRYQLEQIGSW